MLHSLQISLALLFATVSASRAAESSNSIRLVGSPAAPSLINPDGTHNQENANKDLIRVLRRFPQNLDYVALAQELEENGVVAQANLIQKATDSLVQAIAAAKISKANAATARSPAPTPSESSTIHTSRFHSSNDYLIPLCQKRLFQVAPSRLLPIYLSWISSIRMQRSIRRALR